MVFPAGTSAFPMHVGCTLQFHYGAASVAEVVLKPMETSKTIRMAQSIRGVFLVRCLGKTWGVTEISSLI